MLKLPLVLLITAVGLATPSLAQTPNMNQAAVDTLTKEVATVVFANQTGDKATEILNQLSACGGSCDVVAIIRQVGGWDAVGVKMEELGRLKNTAPFQAMSPGDANAAIRREFARFYNRYKRDKNYGVPLSQGVQGQILAKIDGMLPPNVVPDPAPTVAGQPADGQGGETIEPTGNAAIDGTALQISQLERAVKEERTNRIWMIILSAIAGLLAGAGVVYFVLYRALRKDYDRLVSQNAQLTNELETAQRQKVANAPRQPQPENRPRPQGYIPPQPIEPVVPSVPMADPMPPISRAGVPTPAPAAQLTSILEPTPAPIDSQTQSTAAMPVPLPPRDEVFFCPPPDPNGQFDSTQKVPALSPESAYRFSVGAGQPDTATFRFEAEPGRVARFLTYRNYMIEPACDSENSFSSIYTRIVNRRDGEAVVENGTWRVKTKALIRYE